MGPHFFRGNFQDHLKNILGEEMFSATESGSPKPSQFPKINLYESQDQIYLIARLPGLDDPSRLNLSLMGSSITLKGTIDGLYRDETMTILMEESFHGDFERKINLPAAVSGIGTVNYQNGILSVELVKEQRSDAVSVKVNFG